MILHLHTNSPLHKIQSEFTKYFSGLNLDFFFHGDEKLNLSSHHPYSFFFTPVKEFYPDCIVENINIEESMTTKEVENFLKITGTSRQKYMRILMATGRRTECSLLKEYIFPMLKN